MAILIVKLIKQVFHDNESGCLWVTAKAGKENILVQFNCLEYDKPKILKTVEYKIIGFNRNTRSGGKVFEVERYEKTNKVPIHRPSQYKSHLG